MPIDIVSNRNQHLVTVAVVLLILVIVGLGFYLASLQNDLNEAEGQTEKAKQELASAQEEMKSLTVTCETERSGCQESLRAAEEQVAGLESVLESTKSRVGELRDEKKQTKMELAQFKAFSAQFKRMVDAGKLEVAFRRGRMVVNLPAQVLFASGSAELSEEGVKALKEVAKILRTVKDKNFIVGGHTDNEKIKKANFKSNWELSTARALVVTEELIKAGMRPWDLVAAGYSQYAPIATNKTEEGKQKNRRIEIILEPYLKKIKPPKTKSKSGKKKK